MGKSVLQMFTGKPFRLLGPVGTNPQLSAHLNVQTRQNTRPHQLHEDVDNSDAHVVRAGAFKEVVHLYMTRNRCSEPGVSSTTTPANVRLE